MPRNLSSAQRAERRAVRRSSRIHSPLAHISWRTIENKLTPLEVLVPEQVDRLHDASMHILEEIGMIFMDDEALDLWTKAGAAVDRGEQRVRIERGLLMELISHAPSQFTWRARNPERTVRIGGDFVTFAPNGGTVFTQDLDHGRRPGVMADYEKFLKLNQMCNVIHYSGDQIVVPHDVPVSYRHLRTAFSALTLTDKAFIGMAHGRVISADMVEMTRIVFAEDVTRSEQPVLGGVVNASSPLRWDERMIGGILTFARANQALVITPFILAGAMSPITMAAAVAQQNAEALAGIALAQLARRGAPVIYGGFATNVDMKSGGPAFGTPEGAWAMMAGAQFARRYHLPYRGSGSLNTSKLPDAQAVYETMWSIWPAVLAHTNFILHAVGWLESGLVSSFEKFIIDVESLAMFAHLLEGQIVDDETLALDMIAEVGPGGHHFGTAHTQARFSSEYYTPMVADRQDHETWRRNGSEDAAKRANRIWKQMVADYQAPPMDEAIREELTDFVQRRERALAGVDLYS